MFFFLLNYLFSGQAFYLTYPAVYSSVLEQEHVNCKEKKDRPSLNLPQCHGRAC